MRIRKLIAILAYTLSLTPLATFAEDQRGRIFPALTIASDYRFNGMSLSDNKPALQGSIHYWRPDNYFAGLWIANVDFLDSHNTSIEADLYAGRDFLVGKTQLKVQAMYSIFDDDEQGPTYDFLQFKTEISRNIGKMKPMASIAWSPRGSYGAGQTLQLRFNFDYQLNNWLVLEAMAGRGMAENSSERNYYEVGFSASWKTIHFGLHYAGIETDLPLCQYVEWCNNAVVGKITFATY